MIATCFFHTELEYIGVKMQNCYIQYITCLIISTCCIYWHFQRHVYITIYGQTKYWFLNMLVNACVITDFQHCLYVFPFMYLLNILSTFFVLQKRCLKQQCMVNKSILRWKSKNQFKLMDFNSHEARDKTRPCKSI